jgi:hypothetical protein
MKRRLEAELLDHLAADDPAAIASRRDLERINLVMRAPAIMAAALAGLPRSRRLVDLGGGDGRFLLRVARQLPEWRDVTAVIADRQTLLDDRTRAGFAALGWRCEIAQGDIFDTLNALEDGALVMANLFLHHLSDAALEEAFRLLASGAQGFVACEPRRSRMSLLGSHMVAALGANHVSRHDAVVSVRAGFAAQELSALWPAQPGWTLEERPALPFTHLFLARRHAV